MCKFVSGYVTKTGDIYDGAGFTDSHSEIALIHNLRDTDFAFYAQNLAKWECTPPADTTLWRDFAKWEVHADENETPEWFDPEKIRAHVAKLVAPLKAVFPPRMTRSVIAVSGGSGSSATISEW